LPSPPTAGITTIEGVADERHLHPEDLHNPSGVKYVGENGIVDTAVSIANAV
jgi:hypothetical protein